MESATLETLETTGDLTVLILFHVRKSTKRDFSTTILVPPPDSPFRAASTPTLEESASHHLAYKVRKLLSCYNPGSAISAP